TRTTNSFEWWAPGFFTMRRPSSRRAPSHSRSISAPAARTRTAMVDKLKVCMIGATAVGKTSLVARFVNSVFSDRYATTIGVRIHTRRVRLDQRMVDLIIWDLSGEDEFQSVQP